MFGPLICKAGSSKKNKTGSWRIELRPKFDRANCTGCKLCMSVCPEGCILGEDKTNIDFDPAFCAVACPKKSIEMVKEESVKEAKE
jgi:2-oxoacid:acceptor oxidoreductase delta subunit (pyruvate/2-ketoisovalerate family)